MPQVLFPLSTIFMMVYLCVFSFLITVHVQASISYFTSRNWDDYLSSSRHSLHKKWAGPPSVFLELSGVSGGFWWLSKGNFWTAYSISFRSSLRGFIPGQQNTCFNSSQARFLLWYVSFLWHLFFLLLDSSWVALNITVLHPCATSCRRLPPMAVFIFILDITGIWTTISLLTSICQMLGILTRVRLSLRINTFVTRLMLWNFRPTGLWRMLASWLDGSFSSVCQKMVLALQLQFLSLISLPLVITSVYWFLTSLLLNSATPNVICCYAHYWAIAFLWTSLRKSNIASRIFSLSNYFFKVEFCISVM